MKTTYLGNRPYKVPETMESAPYQYLYMTGWMDGLQPLIPDDEGRTVIETAPDGKGCIVFCLEHADIALLDSGICQALLYRVGVQEPLWSIPLDREHVQIMLTSGSELGHFTFRTPEMQWEQDGYFLLLTHLFKSYAWTMDVLGCSVEPFAIHDHTPNYRASCGWKNVPTVTADATDGTYLVPVVKEEKTVSVGALEINGESGKNVRIIGGKQSLSVAAWFDEEDSLKDVVFGVYRVGQQEPLWTIREMVPDFGGIEFNTWVLDLMPGKYFILYGPNESEHFQRVGEFLRQDFTVIPDGKNLTHPRITDAVVTPLNEDLFEVYRNQGYVCAPAAKLQLVPEKEWDRDTDMISIRCFDETGEPVAECESVNPDGHCTLDCFLPLTNGAFRIEILHNGTLFRKGTFRTMDGKPDHIVWVDNENNI